MYTLAFLGLMAFMAAGTMLLKFKRPDLPREASAPPPQSRRETTVERIDGGGDTVTATEAALP